ncbi:MAG: DivIVA domain-containing protein, partial [Pseudonocardiaceae bacterium]
MPALAPETLVNQEFSKSFRGLRATEVRAFLNLVAQQWAESEAQVASLNEQVQLLQASERPPTIDEATLIAALGDHAARILAAARETAAEILAEADCQGTEVLRDIESRTNELRRKAEGLLALRCDEADGLAGDLRTSAETEARVLLEQAQIQAEATLLTARSEGREMVAEAKAIRERMLKDLSRRRQLGELQIEQLDAGRQRLLDAYELVRRTLGEATAELNTVEPGFKQAATARRPGQGDGAYRASTRSNSGQPHRGPARLISPRAPTEDATTRTASEGPRRHPEISISGARRAGDT